MTIPKIIHQTWKTGQLPASFRFFQETWRRFHPDWEYRFYDDSACRNVVESFPSLLPIYDGCPHPVQRADIFRYLVVARYGGLYADMDMECLQNMEPLLAGQHAVFGIEDRLSPRHTRRLNHCYAERIANFIFAAEANHPIFERIIDALKALPGTWDMQKEILETTGPGMLTNVVQDNRERLGLTILPRICWAPPTKGYPVVFPFNLHMYARHHFEGTWKKKYSQVGDQGIGEPDARGWNLWDILYKIPPSPIWMSDLLFWRRKEDKK